MRILSFHMNQSSGIGGIESLYRSFIKLAMQLQVQFHEIYVNTANSSDSISGDAYHMLHKINVPSFLPKGVSSLWRYYQLRKKIDYVKPNSDDLILFISASPLIFLNSKLLNNAKIILIQSNRVDKVFLSLISRLIIYLKRDIISNLVVYTNFDKDVLTRRLPFLEDKVVVIPRGCRLETRRTTSKCGKKLVAISRVEERQKNFRSMVKIMEYLPKEYTLDIYGDGTEDELIQLKNMLEPLANIQFKGPVHDVATCLSEYSIFVMTSHYEGFGQSLIEARSQGVPVVVFDTFEALPDVVSHEVTGFIVPYMNHKLFAERIIELAESTEKYQLFSSNSLWLSANNELQAINNKWSKLFLKHHDV